MAELLIGTSGYDYPEWRGILYPHDLPREEFLSFYAEHFNALEVNYTYYGMPTEYQLSAMHKRSRGRLQFSVKAHQSLTHSITVSQWRDAAKQFRAALNPLLNASVLSAVLLQFPQSFHYGLDERRYLDNLTGELCGLPLTVEFRHSSWQKDRVYEGLRERGITLCLSDLPALRNLPSFVPVLTSGKTYLRFHGRNTETWHGTNARDRYDYLYSEAELSRYKPLLDSICRKAELVQIFFNNHAKGHAVVNARMTKLLLG